MTDAEYLAKGRFIWKNYVPKSGQSSYVQGELLRAIEKLRDESQRNGNINWDEGHEILSNYLLSTIEKSNILNKIELKAYQKDIKRIKDYKRPYTKDDLFDRVERVVIDFFIKNPAPLGHQHNPNLHR